MASRFLYPFSPVGTADIGFNTTLGGAAATYALESSARFWQFPTSRAVQVTSRAADDFFINFGTSDVTVGTTNGMLVMGGAERVYGVDVTKTHIAVIGSSTDVTINIALGYGG